MKSNFGWLKKGIFLAGLLLSAASHAQAAPTGVISSPAHGSTKYGLTSITGTAVPSAGTTISQVRVYLRRLSDVKNWKTSTSSWVTGTDFITPTLTGTNWTVSASQLPSGANLVDDDYSVTLVLVDSTNAYNATPYPSHFFDLQQDYTAPTVTGNVVLYEPLIWNLWCLRGTYANDSGGASAFSRVEIIVQRVSDSYYYHASTGTFQSSPTSHTASLDNPVTGEWFDSENNLPMYQYDIPLKITIRGYDVAGNRSANTIIYYSHRQWPY